MTPHDHAFLPIFLPSVGSTSPCHQAKTKNPQQQNYERYLNEILAFHTLPSSSLFAGLISWGSFNDHICINGTPFTCLASQYHSSSGAQISASHRLLSLAVSKIELLTFLRKRLFIDLLLLILFNSFSSLNLQIQPLSKTFRFYFPSFSWSHHPLPQSLWITRIASSL